MPVATLDLHGLTASEARRSLHNFTQRHCRMSAGKVVHVITGKGTGSEGRAVLWELVQDTLNRESSEHVAEHAGMLGGGGWVMRLKGPG